MPQRFIHILAFALLMTTSISVVNAQDLRIAAAADLQFALKDLGAHYEKQSGTKLAISFGSSGNFFAQIQNGAPFDIFFSADIDYPRKLQAAGLIEPDSFTIYAQGRIVLWTPPGLSFDFAKRGLSVLLDERIQKVAIANPEHAPYGRAAAAALKKAGLYDQLKRKLVFGENISQTAQFVQSGNAQTGIVALSLALSPAMKDGQRWEIPTDLYPTLEQAVVILKSSANKAAAQAFLQYLRTSEAQKTLARYGFSMPSESARNAHNNS
jgi:molybdate transport system substrate-binding protein